MIDIRNSQTTWRESMVPVGVIAALSRCPVKSMRGEALTEAAVGFQGIRGDRRFAFIQGGDHSPFPWLTAREVPRMLLYQATLAEPDDPDNSGAWVTTPAGQHLDIFSDALLQELKGQLKPSAQQQAIYAVHLKSAHDGEPVSVVTTYAVQRLGERIGAPVEARRFRANLLIDTAAGAQPDEQTWIGRRLIIGAGPRATILAITRGDPRCMIPNLDPDTAHQDPRILRTIAQEQANLMGVYAVVTQPGIIRVDDPVYLLTASSA